MLPKDRRYSKEHEWIRVENSRGTIGITDYAQQQLGDVVYIELPEKGKKLKAMGVFGTIESVKAVSELFCPVSGEVVDVNAALVDKPESVNSDPYGTWLIVVTLEDDSELDGLLSDAQYQKYLDEEAEG